MEIVRFGPGHRRAFAEDARCAAPAHIRVEAAKHRGDGLFHRGKDAARPDPVELAAETGPVESIEDLASRKELSEAVAEAMGLLPEEQRTAIILKEYHGMTFQEIADLQGCPLSTVKTRLYQGLAVLRRNLERSGRLTPPEQSGRLAPQMVKRA